MRTFAVSCHHPQWMVNPYTHRRFLSTCGKCPACLGVRHQKYVSLIQEELKHYKYAFFCTLTYSDEFVPKLFRSEDGLTLNDPVRGLSIPYESIMRNQLDLHWFDKKQYFEYSDYSDFQKFIKRLRQNFFRHVPKSEWKVKGYDNTTKKTIYESFTYYGVSEYGPFTLRPHFHCIITSNSKTFAENFEQYFYTSWSSYNRITRTRVSLGERSTCRPCSGSEDAYTAAYCDAVVGLPYLYQKKELKPKHTYSRKTDYGMRKRSEEEISQFLYSDGLREFDGLDKDGLPVIVQSTPQIENKVFPRLPQFDCLTHEDRIRAYGLYKKFAKDLDGEFPDYNNFSFLCHQFVYSLCSYIPSLSSYLSRNYLGFDRPEKAVQRPFYSLFLASKKFYENCIRFNLDSSTYVDLIEEYYKKKDYYRLTDWLALLEELSKFEDVRYYYSLYDGASIEQKTNFPFWDSYNYVNMVSLTNKYHNDRIKSKKERDYQLRGNAVVYEPEKYRNG